MCIHFARTTKCQRGLIWEVGSGAYSRGVGLLKICSSRMGVY